jgi:hypothetical protein
MNEEETLDEKHARQGNELEDLTEPKKATNKSYQAQENAIKRWVNKHPDKASLKIPGEGKYITRQSVEGYFLDVQKDKVVAEGTIDKAVSALGHMSRREKSDLGDSLLNSAAGKVITQVKAFVSKNMEIEMKKRSDQNCPHENSPHNVINQKQISQVLEEKLASGNKWSDVVTVWAITTVMLLRFESAALLTLNKLCLVEDMPPNGIRTPDDGHKWGDLFSGGDEDEDARIDGRMLSILMPPAEQKKMNTKHQLRKTKTVSCYRHRRVERCPCGIIAFALFQKFDVMMGKISFMGRTHVPENQMFWRNISLFDLKYQAAYTSYQKMIKNAGIMDDFNKRTHMRYVDVAVVLQTNLLRVHVDVINTCCSLHQFYTNYYAYREQGCKFCTAQGLTDEQVKTISKHQTSDIFSKSYRSEVSIPVMVCLAGFVPNVNVESYFVPRAAIQLPHSVCLKDMSKYLFPDLQKWEEEYQSEMGDKCKGAMHFLQKMIPFLTECILQDGVFWIHKFPRNSAVQLLLGRLQGKWPDED